jgi:protein-L-isoaspartate(D-aspartate) O-methyltransferase
MALTYTQARERMVQEQLASRGIADRRVLAAMSRVPRHLFIDESLRDRAYDDHPLPIGEGQTISQPYMVALMAEVIQLSGNERVLEVGTGSGYLTAILAELCEQVFSIELSERLAERARLILTELGYQNVTVQVSDGTLGCDDEAPFDAIVVGAAAPCLPRPSSLSSDSADAWSCLWARKNCRPWSAFGKSRPACARSISVSVDL